MFVRKYNNVYISLDNIRYEYNLYYILYGIYIYTYNYTKFNYTKFNYTIKIIAKKDHISNHTYIISLY